MAEASSGQVALHLQTSLSAASRMITRPVLPVRLRHTPTHYRLIFNYLSSPKISSHVKNEFKLWSDHVKVSEFPQSNCMYTDEPNSALCWWSPVGSHLYSQLSFPGTVTMHQMVAIVICFVFIIIVTVTVFIYR